MILIQKKKDWGFEIFNYCMENKLFLIYPSTYIFIILAIARVFLHIFFLISQEERSG